LRANVPNSMRGRALHVGGALWRAFADLATVVRTGHPMPSLATGSTGFEEMQRDPARLHAFQLSMAESSRRAAADVIAAYDFGRFAHVMDVGGGYGALLAAILEAFPKLQGTVLDLPYLSAGAGEYLANSGSAKRARFVSGDFFRAVPVGADCYLLKFIIHDWDDERSLQILNNCRIAAGANGVVAIVERIVPDHVIQSNAHCEVIRGDLTMMAYGGTERTEAQYRELLAKAGLRLSAIAHTTGVFSIIEARAERS
jgi:orsellinic acid C2-O-methyltransferase